MPSGRKHNHALCVECETAVASLQLREGLIYGMIDGGILKGSVVQVLSDTLVIEGTKELERRKPDDIPDFQKWARRIVAKTIREGKAK